MSIKRKEFEVRLAGQLQAKGQIELEVMKLKAKIKTYKKTLADLIIEIDKTKDMIKTEGGDK